MSFPSLIGDSWLLHEVLISLLKQGVFPLLSELSPDAIVEVFLIRVFKVACSVVVIAEIEIEVVRVYFVLLPVLSLSVLIHFNCFYIIRSIFALGQAGVIGNAKLAVTDPRK